MVEETGVIEESPTSTDVNGQSSSPEGVKGASPAQTSETSGASESPSGQQETTTLTDGISKDDHRLPLSRVEEIRQGYEKRIAELEAQLNRGDDGEGIPDADTTSAISKYPAWLQDILDKYPSEQHDEVIKNPIVQQIGKLHSQLEYYTYIQAESEEQAVMKRFPDLKKAGDKEMFEYGTLYKVFKQLRKEDPAQDAYDVVFKDKVLSQREEAAIQKHKQLNEEKKQANTYPGVSGTMSSGRPPLPTKDEEWPAYLAWVKKNARSR